MSLEKKLKQISIPSRKAEKHKFVLVEINKVPYFKIGKHSKEDYHCMLIHDIMENLKLPFDYQSQDIESKHYRIISAGICDVNPEHKTLRLYGNSGQYCLGINEKGASLIQKMLPDYTLIIGI